MRVSEGDVILLYTGRWKRRAAVGPWVGAEDGVAGYHADVAYFLKERGVSFIGHDMSNDVEPHEFYDEVRLPLHNLALVALGVGIFDNLDFERAVEDGAAARQVRIPVHRLAAAHRGRHGVAAEPDRDVLTTHGNPRNRTP